MTAKAKRLGSVCEINPAFRRQPAIDQVCSFVPMDAVDDWSARVVRKEQRPVREVCKGYTTFEDGDVLIAKITPCMENGKCAIARNLVGGIGFGTTEFHVLRAGPEVSPEWVHFFWRYPQTRLRAERAMTGSAGQKRVPTDYLERVDIPVPSLPEQRRIAARLEEADRLRRTRRYALELSDTFLPAAFLEMFGDPSLNPKEWPRATVSDLGRVDTGSTPPRTSTEFFGTAIEWIKSDNITLAQPHPTRAVEGLSESGMTIGTVVEAGSILVTCIAGSESSIGNVVLCDRRVAFNQQINAVTPHADVDSWFLYGLLLIAKPLIQQATTLAMKRMITKSKLERLLLVKPPPPLQQRFAEVVRGHERLRATQREALRQAEHLFQSLLHEAFAERA